MSKQLSPELVKEIREDTLFQPLISYIKEKIIELDTVQDMENLSNKEAAEKSKSNAIAIKKLVEIFEPLINPREIKEQSIDDVQKAKDRYGL